VRELVLGSARLEALLRAVAHNNRGDAYVSQGNFEAAINGHDQAISLNPDFARPFNNCGFAYLKRVSPTARSRI